MRKILNNKDLLQQFINDKNVLTRKELVQKYDVSQSTISRLIKQFSSQNNSGEQLLEISRQNTSKSDSSDSSDSSEENLSKSSSIDQSQQSQQNQQEKQSQQDSIQNDQQSLKVQQSFIENQNNSLIQYLNEEQQPKEEKVVEKKQFIQQRNYQKKNNNNNNYQKQQQIEQVDLNQEIDEQKQNKINNYMVKIRKMIQFFKDEQCIYHIIGSTQNQLQDYVNNLYKKNLEQIELIHKTIQFELLFSRSNDFIQNSIETAAVFIEKMLLVANIDCVGCFQEMKQEPEFNFYFKMMLCDSAYIASAKQIIFMKFIKGYYQKFNENKQGVKKEIILNLNKKVDQQLLEKFQNL